MNGATAHAYGQLLGWAGFAGQEDVAPADLPLVASAVEAMAGRRVPVHGGLWEEAALAPGLEAFAAGVRAAEVGRGEPVAELARWPRGRRFAVALTHDVDQIHDRGVYRTLADLNHLQKVLRGAEAGRAGSCVRRILRSALKPVSGMAAFRRIREIEAGHGYRSTFFFLEGHRGRRFGARYSWDDGRVRDVAQHLMGDGCEIGVHGGYYDFNDASGYRRSAVALKGALGIEPEGIRNHFLRWAYPATWRAQADAGYAYDATFGRNDLPGFRSGVPLPFRPWDEERGAAIDLVVLPLTVMDSTLFRGLALDAEKAWEVLVALLDGAERAGGLATLLWHNNFFAEDEYSDWEATYARVLEALSRRDVWCETAGEVAAWWRRRSGVRVMRAREGQRSWRFRLTADARIDGLVLRLSLPPGEWSLTAAGPGPEPVVSQDLCSIPLPALGPDRPVAVTLTPSS